MNLNHNHPHIPMAIRKSETVLDISKNIMISVSGGSDSDVVLDIMSRCIPLKEDNIHVVFFDTGLEWQATKEHLDFLEAKYDKKIERLKAVKSIPTCCKEYGVPFISKYASEQIHRLQSHGFSWQDSSYNSLISEYPDCKSALKWWCDEYNTKDHNISMFGISRNKGLKQFLVDNPPTFKISNKCCTYAKKDVAKKYEREREIDISVIGVRKAEGGVRAASTSCWLPHNESRKISLFKPIFWFSNDDKRAYNQHFGVCNSKCYTTYGMTRTGCAGCPYGRNFMREIEIAQTYEPKMYKAIMATFGKSYEYTQKYHDFVKFKNLPINQSILDDF